MKHCAFFTANFFIPNKTLQCQVASENKNVYFFLIKYIHIYFVSILLLLWSKLPYAPIINKNYLILAIELSNIVNSLQEISNI